MGSNNNPTNASNDNAPATYQIGDVIRGCMRVVRINPTTGRPVVRWTNNENPK